MLCGCGEYSLVKLSAHLIQSGRQALLTLVRRTDKVPPLWNSPAYHKGTEDGKDAHTWLGRCLHGRRISVRVPELASRVGPKLELLAAQLHDRICPRWAGIAGRGLGDPNETRRRSDCGRFARLEWACGWAGQRGHARSTCRGHNIRHHHRQRIDLGWPQLLGKQRAGVCESNAARPVLG